jgi:hypothetical protein
MRKQSVDRNGQMRCSKQGWKPDQLRDVGCWPYIDQQRNKRLAMVSGWSLWSALAAASRLAYPGWLVQTIDALSFPPEENKQEGSQGAFVVNSSVNSDLKSLGYHYRTCLLFLVCAFGRFVSLIQRSHGHDPSLMVHVLQ